MVALEVDRWLTKKDMQWLKDINISEQSACPLQTANRYSTIYSWLYEARDGIVVKALRYKPAGRGFDSRWRHWNFSVTYPSGRTMALGSTQPLTEMDTRCISWG